RAAADEARLNAFGAPLKGLLHCVPCGCAMTPAHSCKGGKKRYRYYTCTGAQKRGWNTCPSKSIPAGEIERFVVQQIRTNAGTLSSQDESVAAPVAAIDW